MRFLVLLALSCAFVTLSEDGEELLVNGEVDGRRGWAHTPGGTGVEFEIDRKAGAGGKGALSISNETAGDTNPHNWRQMVELPKDEPIERLKLAAMVRLEGAQARSEACVIVNVYDAGGQSIGHARCQEVKQDTDWRTTHCVFDVPEGAVKVHLMAYLVGEGAVWFDDLSLVPTDDPVTTRSAAPAMSDPRNEDLVRGCAADLPWHFSSEPAFDEARRADRPILAYVRCTDDRDNFESARTSIRADAVRFTDDGYSKDVLFRAGPLSEPDVRALIRRRFVPVCVSYILGDHTYGADRPPHWLSTGKATFEVSRSDGHTEPGCLVIKGDDPDGRDPHNWNQGFDVPEDLELPATLELSAGFKTTGFVAGSEATVMVQCWQGDKIIGSGRLPETFGDSDWKLKETKFSVPRDTDRIRVLAYLVGQGEVRFDDLGIRRTERRASRENLLKNGGLEDVSTGALEGFAINARETTTPALVVLDSSGAVVKRLHRFGTLSGELVDRWLRGVLDELGGESPHDDAEEAYLDGDLERALTLTADAADDASMILRARTQLRLGDVARARADLRGVDGPAAALVLATCAMREGDWSAARKELELAVEAEDALLAEEARYWNAWCLDREGRHADARAIWKELASESVFGRRSAACLLTGPRLPLAVSVRAWPQSDELPTTTELGHPVPFDANDAARSITALLEMQRADGSFGSHMGPDGLGWTDPAITAIVIDGLRKWQRKAPSALRGPIGTACERALAFLEQWSQAPSAGADAFNDPYVLMTLTAEGAKDAAERVIARIEAGQLPDGNWTVYHAERPASFNTALCVMALAKAKKARVNVPKRVLAQGLDALEAMRQESGLFPYSTAEGHEWMTTVHGSIARDALCEHALLLGGRGSKKKLSEALARYRVHAPELRVPTKRLYDYFNTRGHGGYYFFFAHRNALEAAALAKGKERKQTLEIAREAVLSAREGDDTFMDKFLLGRAYGTAMALYILAK